MRKALIGTAFVAFFAIVSLVTEAYFGDIFGEIFDRIWNDDKLFKLVCLIAVSFCLHLFLQSQKFEKFQDFLRLKFCEYKINKILNREVKLLEKKLLILNLSKQKDELAKQLGIGEK